MEIKEGTLALNVNGIINLAEVKFNLESNLEKYSGIIWTEETRKDISKLIGELKPERMKVKKAAAAFKKFANNAVEEKYREIKELETLFDKVIDPLEQGEKDFLEAQRVEKYNRKKALWEQATIDLNTIIEALNDRFEYRLMEPFEFTEEFANKSDDNIRLAFEKKGEEIKKLTADIVDKIEGIETACQLLKAQYGLNTELNYKLILRNNIYTQSLSECKKTLDDFAAVQQEAEQESERKAKEAEERKSRLEADRIRKEQEEKDRQAQIEIDRVEKARLADIAKVEAEKKAESDRAEKAERDRLQAIENAEKARLKAEADKVEALAKAERDKQTEISKLKAEQEKKERERIEAENKKKAEAALGEKRKFTFELEMTSKQAVALKEYFNSNKIAYKKL